MAHDHGRLIAVLLVLVLVAASVPVVTDRLAKTSAFDGARALVLSGTRNSIWHHFGESERQAVSENLETFWKAASSQQLTKAELIERALSAESLLPIDYLEEVKALAQGANADYPEVLAFNLLVDVLNQSDECTIIAAAGSGSLTDDTLISKNRDLNNAYAQILVLVTPVDGFAYMGIASAGQVGIAMGINEEGVSIADTTLPVPAYDNRGHSTYTIMENVLEKSANASAAIALIDYMSKHSGATYAVADKDEAALVETVPTIYTPDVSYNIVRDGIAYHTNHYVYEPFHSWVLNNSFGYMWPSSYARYDRVTELLSAGNGTVSASGLMRALRDIKNFGVSGRNAVISAHPEVPSSSWAPGSTGYSIDSDRTVSSGIFVTDAQKPDTLSTMWMAIANPSFSPFVPIHNVVLKNPDPVRVQLAPYMDGTAWNYSVILQRSGTQQYGSLDSRFEAFERRVMQNERSAEENATRLMDAGLLDQASSGLVGEDVKSALDALVLVKSLQKNFNLHDTILALLIVMGSAAVVFLSWFVVRKRGRGKPGKLPEKDDAEEENP